MRKTSFFLLMLIGVVNHGYSQVQVSQEPRHHKVLDNEWVRLLDVHLPPHDTTLMHVHSTPSVFIVLSNTKTGSEVFVEPGKPAFTYGNIWFEGFYNKPRIHRVWNEDTVEFHVMDIELPHKPSGRLSDSIALPYAQQLFDEKPVRAFKVTIGPGKSFNLNAVAAPILVIQLSAPFDYHFIPTGTGLNIANNGGADDQQFVLLYLK